MGWDVSNISRGIKTKDYVYFDLKRGLNEKYEILAYGQGKTKYGNLPIYFAIKNKETGDVFAQVTLTKRKNGFISQKDIGEDAGPYAYDCPKAVFNLLTPTTNEFAQEWRNKVVEYWASPAPKVKVGDVVKFEKPFEFATGATYQTFRFEGGSKFRAVVTDGVYGWYRITNWRDYNYELVKDVA